VDSWFSTDIFLDNDEIRKMGIKFNFLRGSSTHTICLGRRFGLFQKYEMHNSKSGTIMSNPHGEYSGALVLGQVV